MLALITIWLFMTGGLMWREPIALHVNIALAVLIALYVLVQLCLQPARARRLPHLALWLLLLGAVIANSTFAAPRFFMLEHTANLNAVYHRPATWGVAFLTALAVWLHYKQGALRQLLLIGTVLYAVGIISPLLGTPAYYIIPQNKIYISCAYVILLPLGLHIPNKKLRYAYLGAGIAAIILFGTANRTGIVTIAALVAIGLLRTAKKTWQKEYYNRLKQAFAGIALLGLVFLVMLRPNSIYARLDWMAQAVNEWRETPRTMVFGIGAGYSWYESVYESAPANFSHNWLLTTLTENGITGLAALVFMLISIYKTRDERLAGYNWALLAFFIFSQVNEPFWWWQFLPILGGLIYGGKHKCVLPTMVRVHRGGVRARVVNDLGSAGSVNVPALQPQQDI